MALITWIVDGEDIEDGVTNRPLRQFLAILGLNPDVDIVGIPWLAITGTPTTLAGYGITDAAALVHTHTFASLTSKPTTLAGYGITDAAPLVHTHPWSEITGEPTTLAGYGITDAYTDAEVDTLLAGKSAVGHVHAAADVTSGQFAIARLASGAPDGTKFVRDDGTLATPTGTTPAAHTHPVPDDITPGTGGADFNVVQQDGANMKLQPFRVENRTSDPGSPTVGQIWLRTDL